MLKLNAAKLNELRINIPVSNNRLVELIVAPDVTIRKNLYEISSAEAYQYGEAQYQIVEGNTYEYQIDSGYALEEIKGIISSNKLSKTGGRITPNIYVGTLLVGIIDNTTAERCGELKLEVTSIKTSYRDDYRTMLEEITEHCTELLMQHTSPVSQNFATDFNADAKTLYQRFAFIKSILGSETFVSSVHKILSAPVTKWKGSELEKDIRSARKINSHSLRQISGSPNRIGLPVLHPLRSNTTLTSLPSRITVNNKTETVNTPENRFIKYALNAFLSFCGDFRIKLKDNTRIKQEALQLEEQLEQFLSHSIFKEISLPSTLPLNSPVLQRKEGYREVLRVWLMFDLAAKLIWHGGDDVYSGGKRDVAVLYEYWLFFKLLEIIKDVFKIDASSVEKLIEPTSDGLGLKLKQGEHLPVSGIYTTNTRKLNVQFSYNRTFSGHKNYPLGGSWSRNLRPDYTLSVWPNGIQQDQAEEEELIVHIHFDAKYKVEELFFLLAGEDDLSELKDEEKQGNYKRGDLLKMHTYRDAIRRTAGAYVLYPGTMSEKLRGFHELLPGLGAFAISPAKSNTGVENVKAFLNEVVNHFLNRASQRERMSLKTYETHRDNNIDIVNEAMPETYGINRALIPDETFVLVGFYKDQNHFDWIIKSKLYNARAGSKRGSLHLSPQETGAKYLLLHSNNETHTSKIIKIKEGGPRVFSKQDLVNKGYPTNPSQEFYLVYDVINENEFGALTWDITQLKKYSGNRGSGMPFSASITELMQAVVR